MKQRSQSLKKHWNNPGPGHYAYKPTISGTGKFLLSNYRNVTVPSIKTKMNSAKNSEELNMVFPGPGSYNQSIIRENSRSV